MSTSKVPARDGLQAPGDWIQSVGRALRMLATVGAAPRGLTVKHVATRGGVSVATALHVPTPRVGGHREDGTYVLGPEVCDRYRQLVTVWQPPPEAVRLLRRAAASSGYGLHLARFVNARATITATVPGAGSVQLPELIVGFDDAAHALAAGKALLATLTGRDRARYLTTYGMHSYTRNTRTSPDTLEFDLKAAAERRLHTDHGELQPGTASAAVLAVASRDPTQRLAVAALTTPADLVASWKRIRAILTDLAHGLAVAWRTGGLG